MLPDEKSRGILIASITCLQAVFSGRFASGRNPYTELIPSVECDSLLQPHGLIYITASRLGDSSFGVHFVTESKLTLLAP